MVKYVTNWFKRYFAEQERSMLWLVLLCLVIIFAFFGKMLIPVFASIVIAYLLQGSVAGLQRWHVPRVLSVIIVYLLFLAIVVFALLGLLPLLWKQLSNAVHQLPNTLGRGQELLWNLPTQYPHIVSPDQIQALLDQVRLQLTQAGQKILSASLASIPDVILILVYLVLVPLLVYFFLMDKKTILHWVERYLPKDKRLLQRVWREVYAQIGNYVRGKVLEMIIVWLVCYVVFSLMGLQYALLLSVSVGLSVVVPYIGAVVVTIPVVMLAFLQWGWSAHFGYLLLAYAIIITLDANVLVPLLFSETVALHPVAIIIAILIFGGLWGFWGVFFAIPLAAVVKAILNAIHHESA